MPDWRPFVYSGISSVIAEIVTFPIDTVKTRLQIQGQKKDDIVKYKGVFHTFRTITKEEGVKALYSGIKPAVLRQGTYGTLKYGIYVSAKDIFNEQGLLYNENTGRELFSVNVFCAVIAGGISSAIANPTDVLKVRLQNDPNAEPRMLKGFQTIYKDEGIRGLWRGVTGSAQRAIVQTATALPTYDLLKFKLNTLIGDCSASHIISGAAASFTAALVSVPFDVCRTRVMQQKVLINTDKSSVYKGILDCFIKTVQSEGPLALYKGFLAIYFRTGPWNITFFYIYENLRNYF